MGRRTVRKTVIRHQGGGGLEFEKSMMHGKQDALFPTGFGTRR